jgi:hypothetical protein
MVMEVKLAPSKAMQWVGVLIDKLEYWDQGLPLESCSNLVRQADVMELQLGSHQDR